MRAKVHPHRTMVNSGIEACVSVTPERKGGRAYYVGTIILSDVSFRIHQSGVERAQAERQRNVHAWAVGNIETESPLQIPPGRESRAAGIVQVTYHYDVGRFMTVEDEPVDVTDGHFKAAYFCGRNFYISKEW